MWGTKRLPACDCAEHSPEAYATLTFQHLNFARCLARSGNAANVAEQHNAAPDVAVVDHAARSLPNNRRKPPQISVSDICISLLAIGGW
ncbi:hypothetical protein RB10656 [Rhodopirellula baltica SH 1]|uniref:Uncharacterized protein n=1 Tax=Rhodopirellula baltica (strain DSM 10527 / NCIMB 13988 / SH1) TaxID=243090 RepID=Q7UKG4_RHOBA|nr:hypothetical protein RB10656 [Rhodopirellula baltica SH 1]